MTMNIRPKVLYAARWLPDEARAILDAACQVDYLPADRARILAVIHDYDAFWGAVAGNTDSGDFYRMPLPFADKPIELIAAKHRSRARKRRELRDTLRNDIVRQSHDRLSRDCLR